MRKKIIILLGLIIVIAVFGYNYVYQDHRDIQSETSAFTISSKEILEAFQINPNDSEAKYLDKTITVLGTITQIDSQSLVLDNALFCQFQNKISSELHENNNLTIKGRFLGYDDLLEEIKLDQCQIINN